MTRCDVASSYRDVVHLMEIGLVQTIALFLKESGYRDIGVKNSRGMLVLRSL